MPKKNHKGQSRHFITTAEELAQVETTREAAGEGVSELPVPKNPEPDQEESSEEEEEDDDQKHKGVSHLIEVSNPNRVVQKPKKASEVGLGELSRRQKEQQDVDRVRQQAERKQVEADLARLAIIRKQREEEERKLAEAKRLKELKGQPPAAASSKK